MTWQSDAPRPLVVALVNNLAPNAAELTERQFLRLLHAAWPDRPVDLRRFTCLDTAGAGAAGTPPQAPVRSLEDSAVDLVIVTGAEPSAGPLPDEPIWPGITWLARWAERESVPVLWSCLAAHAAILHLDGLARERMPRKLSGVFTCEAVGPATLVAGLPATWPVPHSRFNDVPETALLASGYQLLSRSDAVGADVFARQSGASFLFLQGHPEYGGDTLLREYQRDVRRYVAGTYDAYPDAPHGIFGLAVRSALDGLQHRASRDGRDPALLTELRDILRGVACSAPWQDPARRILANWLAQSVGDGCPAAAPANVTMASLPGAQA